ncbi:MAG: hypothetical protein PHW02_04925 [bacterium]|nr:hypothetical protein [bacterium]
MKQKVQKIAQGVLLTLFVLTILFVEVNSVTSVSKVIRAEKNFKTIESI